MWRVGNTRIVSFCWGLPCRRGSLFEYIYKGTLAIIFMTVVSLYGDMC